MSYCPNCGNNIAEGIKFCQNCGSPQIANSDQDQIPKSNVNRDKYKRPDSLIFPTGKKKSPVLAALSSLVFGGLGQLYLGQINAGVCFIIVEIIAGLPTAGVGYLVPLIASIIYAYNDAEALNSGIPIRKWGGKGRLKKEYREKETTI